MHWIKQSTCMFMCRFNRDVYPMGVVVFAQSYNINTVQSGLLTTNKGTVSVPLFPSCWTDQPPDPADNNIGCFRSREDVSDFKVCMCTL